MDDVNTKAESPSGEKQKNSAGRWRKTAIILSLLAAVFVLIAVGICLFIWYSGSVHGSMFAERNVKLTESVPPAETSAPPEQKAAKAPGVGPARQEREQT